MTEREQRFERRLSEAQDNIIKATVALRDAKRAKAYWERRIAEENGARVVEGNTPVVPMFKRRAGLAALVGAY